MPGLDNLCSSLCPALVRLANSGHLQTVHDLVTGMSLAPYLWGSVSGPRLLYVALASRALDLAIFLVESFVSFLCNAIVSWETSDYTFQRSIQQCLEGLQTYQSSFYSAHDSKMESFAILVSFWVHHLEVDMGLVFHELCGLGYSKVVKLMLEHAGSAGPTLVNKLDPAKRSPLYYAACGGHLSIVQHLIDECCIVYSDSSELPLFGLLLYFCLAPHAQECYKEHCGKMRQDCYRVKDRLLTSGIQQLLPLCYFSLAFKNSS